MNETLKNILEWILRPIIKKPTPTPTHPQLCLDLLKSHNEERSKYGAQNLTLDQRLITTAELHAKWMSDNRNMSHTGNKRSSPQSRITDQHYIATYSGENVAYGYTSIAEVMHGWMTSPGHRFNILSRSYKNCGFGSYKNYWCTVFGTESKNNQIFIGHYSSGPLKNYKQSDS